MVFISNLSRLTSEAEIAHIHLEQAIFFLLLSQKSKLILLLPPSQIVSVEKPLKQSDIKQVSAETNSNEILSVGLAVSQSEVMRQS